MLAQPLPIHLHRASHQHHRKAIPCQPEENATHDLRRTLAAFACGLLQRLDRAGVGEQSIRNAQLVERRRNGRCGECSVTLEDGVDAPHHIVGEFWNDI